MSGSGSISIIEKPSANITAKKHHIPIRYIPKNLSKKDKNAQLYNLKKSRRLYKKGVYFTRPGVKSFTSKKSNHIKNAQLLYGVEKIKPTAELSKKTGCSITGLKKIIKKGQGAYFSSGSRPNQTAQSWGIARLASSITGGPASLVDKDILNKYCKKNSKAKSLLYTPKPTIN